jgi:hypothetical protein
MFKYFFSIIFFFLLGGTRSAFSQSTADTIATTIDSGSTVNTDSAAITVNATPSDNVNENSIYKPVMDSAFLDQYALRQVSQMKVDKYLKDPDYAYANDPQYWKEDDVQQRPGSFWKFFSNKVFQWILFLGILCLILFGIYRLARENNFKWFTRTAKQGDFPGEEPVTGDRVDYDEAIRRYQLEGNYRMAVRFMYLRLIYTASEKNVIQIRDSTTNAEIMHAFGAHPQAAEFRFLATAYEYIFYGDFHPGQQLFEGLHSRFLAFQQILSD